MTPKIMNVLLSILVAVALGLANCGTLELRSLEAENALLRAQLYSDNNVRQAAIDNCEDARVMLESECIIDRVTLGDVSSCPAFDKCYEQCLAGGDDAP